MYPVNFFAQQVNTLVRNSTDLMNPASPNLLKLVNAPFTPTGSLVYADLSWATFDGSDPIANASGAPNVVFDPDTGQWGLVMKEPAGGFTWIVGDAGGLPETIYGYALVNSDEDTLLASALLPSPIVLTATGQFVQLSALFGYCSNPTYQ